MTWITGDSELDEPEVIAYSENEQYSAEAWTAQVTLRVPWEDRLAVFENIIQNNLKWPYNPTARMIAMSGTITPMAGIHTGVDGNLNTYPKADIQLTFSRKAGQQPNEESTEFYTETLEPNGEMLKLPPEMREGATKWRFRWGEASDSPLLRAEEAPTRLTVGLDYVIRWVNMDSIPAAALDIVDHVNNADVVSASLGMTFEEDTLLANAPVISRTFTSNFDENKWNMEIRLSHRRAGWNSYWDVRTQEFKQIWLHIDGEEPVLYRNFPATSFDGVLP